MIICPDRHRVTALGTYDPSPEASALAWKLCFDQLHDAIRSGDLKLVTLLVGAPGSGKSTWAMQYADDVAQVVFDATFSRKIEREPIVEIARTAKLLVDAVVFLTPISVCIARNWRRSEDRRVPYPVISSMHENLRREPVTLDEGFDSVQAIRAEIQQGYAT